MTPSSPVLSVKIGVIGPPEAYGETPPLARFLCLESTVDGDGWSDMGVEEFCSMCHGLAHPLVGACAQKFDLA